MRSWDDEALGMLWDRRCRKGETYSSLAKEFGVSETRIRALVTKAGYRCRRKERAELEAAGEDRYVP